MSTKVKLNISSAVSAYVRPGTSLETRLSGCKAAADMVPVDRVTLLFCLTRDSDPLVKSEALRECENLPVNIIAEYSAAENALPLIANFVSGLVNSRRVDDVNDQAGLELPDASGDIVKADPFAMDTPLEEEGCLPLSDCRDEDEESQEDGPIDEEGEAFLSKYKIAQMMGIGEKIKMALSGDKEWRSILIKDTNKLVSGSVIKNPRITEAEVLKLIKGGVPNDEIMRLICANKEWVKNYQIRKSLIENNRTPVQNAIRYLATMSEKDLSSFAKSKNITSVISTMAKRMLLNKKK